MSPKPTGCHPGRSAAARRAGTQISALRPWVPDISLSRNSGMTNKRRTSHGRRQQGQRTTGGTQWTQATPAGYMPGFGNDFETEALPGALPVGQNSPQTTRLRPLCRAALGLALHGAARHQRALLALPHPPVGASTRGRFKKIDAAATGRPRRATGEHDRPIGQLRWGPVPIPKEPLTFLTGMRTMTTAGDVNTQAGMAAHVYLVTAVDGERLLLQRRRRDAGRAAAGTRCASSPSSAASRSSPARSASSRAASSSRSS